MLTATSKNSSTWIGSNSSSVSIWPVFAGYEGSQDPQNPATEKADASAILSAEAPGPPKICCTIPRTSHGRPRSCHSCFAMLRCHRPKFPVQPQILAVAKAIPQPTRTRKREYPPKPGPGSDLRNLPSPRESRSNGTPQPETPTSATA